MIILDCEQGTEEWHLARLGIPSGSNFSKIITPSGTETKQSEAYMNKCLAGWLIGKPEETYTSAAMERGILLEPEARETYEFITDNTVKQVGLIYKDEKKLVSVSPDGLIEQDGLQEIKCPESSTHVEYLLQDKFPSKYKPQVQGQLWISEREWCDFVSYYPNAPVFIKRVYRDKPYIKKMSELVEIFIEEMLEKREKLRGIKCAA